MKPNLVLITLSCQNAIGNIFCDIAVVIPALPNDRREGYRIDEIIPVGTTAFKLVIVSNITLFTI